MNNLPGINDNARERGVEQKCFQTLTEGRQRRGRYHFVRQAVPDGGSVDREGPAADGRQFHGRHQQTIGPSRAEGTSTRQIGDRHEPTDQLAATRSQVPVTSQSGTYCRPMRTERARALWARAAGRGVLLVRCGRRQTERGRAVRATASARPRRRPGSLAPASRPGAQTQSPIKSH